MHISLYFNRDLDKTTVSLYPLYEINEYVDACDNSFNITSTDDELIYDEIVKYLNKFDCFMENIIFITLHTSLMWTEFVLWFYNNNLKENNQLNFYCIDLYGIISTLEIMLNKYDVSLLLKNTHGIDCCVQAWIYVYMRRVLSGLEQYRPEYIRNNIYHSQQLK
jgi:hypothetical protein